MSFVLSMSRKARHNAKVRARLLDAAGPVFCAKGYGGASLDRITEAAGLTRGAFYSHFPSKAALFEEVLRTGDPVTRALARRSLATEDAAWLGLRHILAACLSPRHLGALRGGWVLAALMGEARSAGPGARAAWDAGFRAFLDEGLRGAPCGVQAEGLSQAMLSVLCTVSAASALGHAAPAGALLDGARAELAARLDALERGVEAQPRIGYRSGSSKMSKTTEPA